MFLISHTSLVKVLERLIFSFFLYLPRILRLKSQKNCTVPRKKRGEIKDYIVLWEDNNLRPHTLTSPWHSILIEYLSESTSRYNRGRWHLWEECLFPERLNLLKFHRVWLSGLRVFYHEQQIKRVLQGIHMWVSEWNRLVREIQRPSSLMDLRRRVRIWDGRNHHHSVITGLDGKRRFFDSGTGLPWRTNHREGIL